MHAQGDVVACGYMAISDIDEPHIVSITAAAADTRECYPEADSSDAASAGALGGASAGAACLRCPTLSPDTSYSIHAVAALLGPLGHPAALSPAIHLAATTAATAAPDGSLGGPGRKLLYRNPWPD